MMIIDRFEGNFAVVEVDGAMCNIERSKLPGGAKEGDVIRPDGSGFIIDRAETEKRRNKNIGLQNSLWE